MTSFFETLVEDVDGQNQQLTNSMTNFFDALVEDVNGQLKK